ncbi:addiction module antidote protein [Nitrospirillum viridazoti]|uniref:Addiction module antidote protein n=1 Tax=Nitrospirillum amazonense TaxID=28077 RepID=A0A560J4R0_9PROT|nr:addiction module antidote protein [Nitrospirillum amazonense]TWB63570.1 putative addiction module antidote protein [Nitrospirillum amazonense]
MTDETNWEPFDASRYLDDEETIAEYLRLSMDDENPDIFLLALADVAKARGMAHVAATAGLGRESLYKALTPGTRPRYDTIKRVLSALNLRITVVPSAPAGT